LVLHSKLIRAPDRNKNSKYGAAEHRTATVYIFKKTAFA
jgi:hypothetical protein